MTHQLHASCQQKTKITLNTKKRKTLCYQEQEQQITIYNQLTDATVSVSKSLVTFNQSKIVYTNQPTEENRTMNFQPQSCSTPFVRNPLMYLDKNNECTKENSFHPNRLRKMYIEHPEYTPHQTVVTKLRPASTFTGPPKIPSASRLLAQLNESSRIPTTRIRCGSYQNDTKSGPKMSKHTASVTTPNREAPSSVALSVSNIVDQINAPSFSNCGNFTNASSNRSAKNATKRNSKKPRKDGKSTKKINGTVSKIQQETAHCNNTPLPEDNTPLSPVNSPPTKYNRKKWEDSELRRSPRLKNINKMINSSNKQCEQADKATKKPQIKSKVDFVVVNSKKEKRRKKREKYHKASEVIEGGSSDGHADNREDLPASNNDITFDVHVVLEPLSTITKPSNAKSKTLKKLNATINVTKQRPSRIPTRVDSTLRKSLLNKCTFDKIDQSKTITLTNNPIDENPKDEKCTSLVSKRRGRPPHNARKTLAVCENLKSEENVTTKDMHLSDTKDQNDNETCKLRRSNRKHGIFGGWALEREKRRAIMSELIMFTAKERRDREKLRNITKDITSTEKTAKRKREKENINNDTVLEKQPQKKSRKLYCGQAKIPF